MTLSVPRYPEFEELGHWSEREQFYVPELEMCFGEICSAMKKCWIGYKWARRELDTEVQEHYADIIQGIIEALGYKPMKFQIAESYDMFSSMDMVDPELMITDPAAAQQVEDIDQQVEAERERRRQLAIEYGRRYKRLDWDTITKQYVTYVSPEDVDDQEYMLEVEDEEEAYL